MKQSNSRTRNTITNIASSFGGRLLKTILTFVVRTVFIQALGKSYLGVNGIFTSILNMLSLAELGFGATIVYHLYKPLAVRDNDRIRTLIKFYKYTYRVIGFVILFLGICLIPLLPVLIRDYDTMEPLGINAVLIFVIYLLQSAASYLFFAYRQTVIEADQKKYIIDLAECGKTILEALLQLFSLIVLKSFLLYTLSTLVSIIIYNFTIGFIARRLYPDFFSKEGGNLSREEIISLFKDCSAMFLYKSESVVLKATDNMVLSAFIGLGTVGLYSSYLLIINACKGFLDRFYVSVKHSMGNLYATESVEKKFRYFEIMNFLTFILYGTAAVGLITCCDDLIRVWIGDAYVIAFPFSVLLGVEILFDGLIRNLTQIRNISGAFRQLWYRPVISIVVNIVSSIILVQYMGINGVIIGTIFAQLFVGMIVDPYVVMNYCFKKYKTIGYYYLKNLGFLLVLICACFLNLLSCRIILPAHTWSSVIVHAIIVGITVPAVFFLVYIKTPECQHLLGLTSRILKRIHIIR